MEITLIYPHQLFRVHPAIQKGRKIYLIEDPLFFGNDPHWPTAMHAQKLVLHRVTMKAYQAELKSHGHDIHYIECPSGFGTSSGQLLDQSLPKGITKIHLADPSDEILLRRLRRFASQRSTELSLTPSPNFITPPELIRAQVASKKRPFMATFYEAQRKRTGILTTPEGLPHGGKWSFDTENRQKLPKGHIPPREPLASKDKHTLEAIEYISQKFPNNPGNIHSFRWPATRSQAEQWLDCFIEERLANFGAYEDAISIHHPYLYHAAITPMLNIGLLDPQNIIERVLSHADRIPMNSLEGFIRQIIGWREFMHGIYRHKGSDIRRRNFWNFETPLPQSFYHANTGIPPIDRVIRQLLQDGYCHHIERLMILGNFMLLCRIKPDDVYRWFMEMFVDSYDWVMVPNVYGMSQYADGGTFTTKPYFSGSNYILKMSDEPKGEWCKIWDALFWTFIGDHTPFFLKNPRLSMMARTWEKQSAEKQETHRQVAASFLAQLK